MEGNFYFPKCMISASQRRVGTTKKLELTGKITLKCDLSGLVKALLVDLILNAKNFI